ncbi:NlpC/P60 family protein [Terricaulis sp.]|uniref:NlpC/P60 family protein n=1 Tax=Terricaulis sp. TaxID=2768686 RepID=UPI0037835FC0
MISRSMILAEARDWIGTPYQHQASAKGAGCDCIGLVRGVWRALYGDEPEAVPGYTPDWAERAGAETLLDAARRNMREVSLGAASPGDVLLFRMDARAPVKHAAILDEDERIIHAYWGRAVVRSRFAPWWRARFAAAFQFPGVDAWPK